MKFLVWDTSSTVGCVCAAESDSSGRGFVRVIAECTFGAEAAHSERLAATIHWALGQARWSLDDLDWFGTTVGPGSFTGVRIGLATARAFAFATKKPLIGVSSLAVRARPVVLALEAGRDRTRGRVVIGVAMDACKGELYGLMGTTTSLRSIAAFSEGPGRSRDRGVIERLFTPESFSKVFLRKFSQSGSEARWVLVGDAVEKTSGAWKFPPPSKRLPIEGTGLTEPAGRYVAQVAWEAFQTSGGTDWSRVQPRYYRESDAERKRLQKRIQL